MFVFSCNSGGSSGGDISNCNGCPDNSLSPLIDLNESNNTVTCNYSEISNLGCANVIEAEVDENNQTIMLYYNIEPDISGIQFDLKGVTIDGYESYISNSFDLIEYSTLNNDDVRFIALSLNGNLIQSDCGVLFKMNYSSAEGSPWDSSDFIHNIVFSGVFQGDSPTPIKLDVCAN